MPAIAAAHGIAYVATRLSLIRGTSKKVQKGIAVRGPAYLQIHGSLQRWMGLRQRKNDRDRTTRRGNRTLDDVRIVDGELVNVMKVPRQQPVEEYLKQQRRFAHLFKMPGAKPKSN